MRGGSGVRTESSHAWRIRCKNRVESVSQYDIEISPTRSHRHILVQSKTVNSANMPPNLIHSLKHHPSQSSLRSSTTYHSLDSPSPTNIPAVEMCDRKENLAAILMSRADSGYADTLTPPSKPTISTAPPPARLLPSSRRSRQSSQDPSSPTSSTHSTNPQKRPRPNRAPASSPSTRSSRPSSTPRFHTTSAVPQTREVPYSYFQFPELSGANTIHSPPGSAPTSRHGTAPPPPSTHPRDAAVRHVPATVQYWTSPETRRREYEAIDAASSGVKGFCLKILPECMVPREYKVLGFSQREEEEEGIRMGGGERRRGGGGRGKRGGDAGSVRRYRISLDEDGRGAEKPDARRGRWWRFGRR